MKIKLLVLFLFISSVVISQEIGNINRGNHFIKLLKSNNSYSFIYSDITSEKNYSQKLFHFNNREALYSTLIDGFNVERNHQVICKQVMIL